MDVVYGLASKSTNGSILVTSQELLEQISYKTDFRESDVEVNLNRLSLDNYCTYKKAKRSNGDSVYLITLKDNGISYFRDKQTNRKKMITRIVITILIAALSFSMKSILSLIFG